MDLKRTPFASIARALRICLRRDRIRDSLILVSGAVLVAEEPAAAAKPKVLSCAYRDAVVFRDRNKNGVLDPGEPSRNTGEQGDFLALGGKGLLTLTGGVDLVTGIANDRVLTTPENSKGVGTLTALWQALLDRKQSEKKIKKLLGLPAKAKLANFSAGQPAQASTTTAALRKKDAEIEVEANFASALANSGRLGLKFSGAATIGRGRSGEDPVIGALADALLALKQATVDLTSPATNQRLLQSAVSRLGGEAAAGNLAIAATVTSGINRLIETQPEKVDTLKQIAAQGAALAKAGDFDSLVTLYTSTALEQQLNAIYIPTATITSITDDAGVSVDFTKTFESTTDNSPLLIGTKGPGITQMRIMRGSAPLNSPNPVIDTNVATVPVVNGAWTYASSDLFDGCHAFVAVSLLPSGLPGGPGGVVVACVNTSVANASPDPEPVPRLTTPPLSVTRVSLDSEGRETIAGSSYASVSADARYVAFSSSASNLVDGDTNSVDDIFMRDTLTGRTSRVSVSSSGGEGDGSSTTPSISADGRYVAFTSISTNLVDGDTNSTDDVFVHDTQTGVTTRVSVASNGAEANGGSVAPSISGDGRYVAFTSLASNLVDRDRNSINDVFVRDMQNGTTSRVSVANDGGEGNSFSIFPSISGDGRYVAFTSLASNLVDGDTNATNDVFLRDIQAGTTSRVSVSTDGSEGNGLSLFPSISSDGRFVAFTSSASNLVEGDTNLVEDVFLRALQSGTTTRVSVASDGSEAIFSNYYTGVAISADGRYVAFNSLASNLVPDDTNFADDVFVRDTLSGATTRVSFSKDGVEANAGSIAPSISADGRFVAIGSEASNLVAGDTNAVSDIFLIERAQ